MGRLVKNVHLKGLSGRVNEELVYMQRAGQTREILVVSLSRISIGNLNRIKVVRQNQFVHRNIIT